MSLTTACCNLPPVTSSYTKQGQEITIPSNNVPTPTTPFHAYVAPLSVPTPHSAVIFIYDIFGFHPNAFQAADRIANLTKETLVIVPDYFLGKSMPEELLGDMSKLVAWIGENGDYKKIIRARIVDTVKYLKEQKSVKKVAFVGFCWGAKMAILAARDEEVNSLVEVKGVAQCHPSFPAEDDYKGAHFPVAILPSKDETDQLESWYNTHLKASQPKSLHRRFNDQSHGFCAARGDWSDPKVAEAASEAFKIVATFFNEIDL
ncbi:Alpha/Beta hydrolase protein [Fimicolochytrium jonesii]|uniref:Alpha/Beta hydrolase protein n=1 Tax=Fimicolochytrium jonesii TaxID=1396493 RepID=UPI0022FE7531|nr:Alpha/Beta hydrolase protein [Fimicolochytrium jonesii]KAI8818517.1 Alpha/Beta hydrolase protein [Fimicolochytrium jonesii]